MDTETKGDVFKLTPKERFKRFKGEEIRGREKIGRILAQLDEKRAELFPGMEEIQAVVREANKITRVRSSFSGISQELTEFLNGGKQEHFLIDEDPSQPFEAYAQLGSEEAGEDMEKDNPVEILDGVYSRDWAAQIVFSPAAVERLRKILERNKISVDDYGELVDPNKEKE